MPLVYLAAAWVAGTVSAARVPLPMVVWAIGLALALGLVLIWRRDPLLLRVHLCLLVFCVAALRYAIALPHFDENSLAFYNDRGAVALVGIVTDPPQANDRTLNVHLAVTELNMGGEWRTVTGTALVQLARENDVRYGDRLQISGTLTTPPEFEDFSYKDYLARQGIHSLVRTYGTIPTLLAREQGDGFHTPLYAFKARTLATVHTILPEPSASLLAGILLGDDSGMPPDLTDAFSATNTAHIIAISGFNIAILAGIFAATARRVFGERGVTALFVILGLALYTLLVGASASVVRAAIMGSLSVIALYYHRRNDALNALAIAALIMTMQNPLVVFDVGFQLSFLATLGLIFFVPPLTVFFETNLARVVAAERAKQIVGLLSDSFIVTLAAQITTTPLIVFTFHRLSLVGLAANFFALPAQPAVMLWGGIATIAAMIVQPIGQIIGWVAYAFLQYTIIVVEFAAHLPFAALDVGEFGAPVLALYYVLLAGVVILRETRLDWRALLSHISFRPALALGVLLVVGIWAWNVALTAPDGKTHVLFLDGANAATFIRTPRGARVLIDGGAAPSVVLSALGERMPFWDRSLDLLVLTNGDDDHLAGLVAALERFHVRQVVQVKAPKKVTAAYQKWGTLIADKRVPSVPAESGLQIAVDRDVTLEIVNAFGITRLNAGGVSFLFADSATADDQAALISSAPASTVLIAPRQLAPEFLDAASPQFAIVFAGTAANEHPPSDLLSALASTTILRTDERGTIEFVTDGRAVTIHTTR